jgi:prevent-host-death family protein
MIDLSRDIHPLTDFKRKTAEFMKRLKRTGHPLVLTVNGKAELVVHDAKSYQKLLDAIERAEAVRGIRRGLESFKEGKGVPLQKADERIRRKHGIPR